MSCQCRQLETDSEDVQNVWITACYGHVPRTKQSCGSCSACMKRFVFTCLHGSYAAVTLCGACIVCSSETLLGKTPYMILVTLFCTRRLSGICDELTLWHVDRVTTWPCDVLTVSRARHNSCCLRDLSLCAICKMLCAISQTRTRNLQILTSTWP